MDLNKRIAELKAQIMDSFAARPYPGDDSLVMADALVDCDARDLLNAVKGRSWQEAAPFILTVYLSSSIWYFTPAGYQYYLPAYLTYLLHWKGNDVLGEAIVSSLEPSSGDDSWFNERFSGLSGQERETITDVVKFVFEVNDYDKGDPVFQFWKNFESN